MPAYRTVIFDCDSTLSAIEGIDELAAVQGVDVSDLTAAAMRGEVPLEQVYGLRLDLVRPTREQVDALARAYVERLVPDAREVVQTLLAAGIDVRILSGGVRTAVWEVARAVGLPLDHVAAVDLQFDAEGRYKGFDAASPLTRVGGKCLMIREWRDLPRPTMMVGDGSTDLETRPLVDLFVAYTGVVARENVVRGADVVIRSLSLAPVVAIACGDDVPDSVAARALVARGRALLDASPDA